MRKCTKCREGLLERFVKPEHTEDLGGIVVTLRNAAIVYQCTNCGAKETGIPDMQGLMKAVAITRVLDPTRLSGPEVRFMRRVLDMKQKEFAQMMDLTPETVSRWENDAQGVGGASEKLLRHNMCALLHKEVPGLSYDPAKIVKMKFRPGKVERIAMSLVRIKHDSEQVEAWDEAA